MTDSAKSAVEFVRYVLEQICENKSEINIESQKDDMGILITVSVDESDMGKLIGKQGQTIGSLRTLVRIVGARENERVNLKVLDAQ